MSLIAKGTLSLRKQDVLQQKKAGTAYRRLVFAHKATAGETGITVGSLVQPSEMAALGFTNPSNADILAANILFYKKNLTVISSARGVLMQDLSYTVPTSARIEFQGFTALEGEIFTCLLETGVRDGLTLVDASPIVATGELAIGATDFNVGTPFEVNKYNSQQIGAVLVFRNGQIQFRNPSNGTSGGNYQEVDDGSGLSTIIRFNNAPISQTDNIIVWGHHLAERPDGSMMASIESLAGQIDAMIPTLAALAGVPETTFQGAPNNQDLKAFGDRVEALESLPNLTSNISTIKTPTVNPAWHSMTSNSIVLTPGTYKVFGQGDFFNSGVSPGYFSVAVGFFGSNGSDTAAIPTDINTIPGISVISFRAKSYTNIEWAINGVSNSSISAPEIIVLVTNPVTIYVNAYSSQNTAANARIVASINAMKIKD